MSIKFPFRIRYERRKAYGVNFVSGFVDETQVGECCPNTKQIKIKQDISEKEKVATLLHEIFHLQNFELELGITEDQVGGLEIGFVKALELNPDLVRIIYETYRKSNRGAK